MKHTKAMRRISPRQIVNDEEASRQAAYDLYLKVQDLKYLRDTLPKEEEFFQKPIIGKIPSSSRNPRLRTLGTNARGDSGKNEESKGIKRQQSISQHELIP